MLFNCGCETLVQKRPTQTTGKRRRGWQPVLDLQSTGAGRWGAVVAQGRRGSHALERWAGG